MWNIGAAYRREKKNKKTINAEIEIKTEKLKGSGKADRLIFFFFLQFVHIKMHIRTCI